MNEERTQRFHVRTPEGVSFSFRLASPVLRLAALVIDGLIVSAVWMVIVIPIQLMGLVSVDFAVAVKFIAYFVLSQGYRMAMEWLRRGRTVGKQVMRLRVVDDRGMRLGFSQIVLRNLLRFVDALPFAYLVGGIAALTSRKAQRLGDLAAGTVVIWEPEEPAPDFAALSTGKYNSLRAHAPAVARLRQAVSPIEARAAWQALARRERLGEEARVALFAELAAHFKTLTPVPAEAVEGVSDEQFVRNVVEVLFLDRARAVEGG